LPGGYVVRDATGQALAYLYSRDNDAEARQAKVLTKDKARRIAINIARLPELLGKGERDSVHRFELQTHPFCVSPHGNTVLCRMIEGQVKFRGQRNGIVQYQPNAGGRKVSHGAIDDRVALKQDGTWYTGQVPRVGSPFNTLVFRSDEMLRLELRQMQPSLGLKYVLPLSPWILRAKRQPNALQRLSLEPFCSRGLCHLPWAPSTRFRSTNITQYGVLSVEFSKTVGLRRPCRATARRARPHHPAAQ
jgi:hypothetical protein